VSNESRLNGTSATDKGLDSKDANEKKTPSQALFIRNAKDEEEARSLVGEDDRSKVDRVEKSGNFWIVHFKSPEEMSTAFKRIPHELKQRQTDPTKPSVAIYRDIVPRHGAGNWQASNRGGTQGAGGYRSGGASDSEGGRGAFRGGRGARGNRGGERGARGPRGGRGGFNKGATEGGSAPSGDSKPTPSGGDS
jgi:hypothetical protein